jgi:phage regulator Rha-like protein
LDRNVTPEIHESKYMTRGKEFFQFILNKRDSFVLMARLSPEFTGALVDRWLKLEDDLLTKHQAALDRATMRNEFLPMTDAIKQSREEQGKTTKFFHYANEADLINKALTGMTAKKYKEHHQCEEVRDHLSPAEKEGMVKMQRANTVWIEEGYTYKERKVKMEEFYHRVVAKKIQAEAMKLLS